MGVAARPSAENGTKVAGSSSNPTVQCERSGGDVCVGTGRVGVAGRGFTVGTEVTAAESVLTGVAGGSAHCMVQAGVTRAIRTSNRRKIRRQGGPERLTGDRPCTPTPQSRVQGSRLVYPWATGTILASCTPAVKQDSLGDQVCDIVNDIEYSCG